MKSLIIGAAGFVGYYLIKELKTQNDIIYASKLPNESIDVDLNVKTVDLDITNINDTMKVLSEIKPDSIYHLAAQSSVALSWEKPQMTANINFIGTINVLESVRVCCPKCRVLIVGSSEEYGPINVKTKIKEDVALNPKNIYALTKASCESLAKLYVEAYGLEIMMTRSFNHIGPRQLPTFVVSDFCNQVVKIEYGLQAPTIFVGNLNSFRDFTDVRDIVRAYHIILTKGKKGEVYNVGTGKVISIAKILDKILEKTNKKIEVKIDEKKFRPIDIEVIVPDISKLNSLKWIPVVDLDESIFDILDYFRESYKR